MGSVLHPDVDPGPAIERGAEVGRLAAPYAAQHDADGTFADEGYIAVRKLDYGSLAVPRDLGGEGHGLMAICGAEAAMAAGCPGTALAIAMHSHAVLTLAWRRAFGDDQVEPVLRRVAEEGLILAASGTLHAANISVRARAVDGGFLIDGGKRLVSGAPGADVVYTTAKLETGDGWKQIAVLAPLKGEGVTIVDDWDSLGMRSSGTNSVRFAGAYVPAQDALYVERPARLRLLRRGAAKPAGEQTTGIVGDDYHGLLMPGLHISLPIIGSVYLGAAEAAGREAIESVAGTPRVDNPGAGALTGRIVHELRLGRWALEGMIRDTADDQLGTPEQMITTALGKRQVVLSAIGAAEAAMELLGSATYMRGNIYERTLRDVRAGITHPLPPEGTLVEAGWATLDLAEANR